MSKSRRILPLFGLLSAISLVDPCVPVQAASSPLVDLVLEKRVMGDLQRVDLPTIDPSSYQTEGFTANPSLYGPIKTVQQPLMGARGVVKRYAVAPEPENYQSLIRIYDAATGKKRGQLTVGRRIQSLIASPSSNSLYVLCGGYFGSIWEIDTAHDVVRRKLPDFTPGAAVSPLWNPKNMALMAQNSVLAVGSDRLQLIDVRSGQLLQTLSLPDGAVEVSSLQALPGDLLGVGLRYADGSYQRYQAMQQPDGSYQLLPGGGAAAGQRSLWAQVKTFDAPPPAISQLFFVASRNSDYVRMVDRRNLQTQGILPVDFNVDELTLSSDHKRLFVYNRRFGQISVIELDNRSPESFSVIKRFRDQRFATDDELKLAAAAGQVFLWDGENQILAGIDSTSLYPRMNVSFGVKLPASSDSPMWVSQPAHQRFYTRGGKLYAEFMDADPSELPMELSLGSPVLQLQLSDDRRKVFALTAARELVVLNSISHEVLQRRNLIQETEGMTPRYMGMASDHRHLYVVDADQGLVRVYQTQDLKYVKSVAWNMGLNQPQQINLYDTRLAQLIQVELPRYLNDVVRVTQ